MGQFPPAQLPTPGPRGALVASILWWPLFAIAIVGFGMTLWAAIADHRANTAFGRLGVEADFATGCTRLRPASRAALAAWPTAMRGSGGCVTAVGDRPVPQGAMPRTVAALLDGPENGEVRVTIGAKRQNFAATLVRRDANLPEARPAGEAWSGLGQRVAFGLVGLLLALVALLLRRRRDDPVSILIAFAFVMMGNVGFGESPFWGWLGYPGVGAVLLTLGQVLLVIAFAAFPNGVFESRGARWLVVIAPLLLFVPMLANQWSERAEFLWLLRANMVLVPLIGLLFLLSRYRRMPAGLEKQQVRWAVFGLAAGLPLLILTAPLTPEQMGIVPPEDPRFLWLSGAYVAATILGYGVMAAGVGISLLRYRLNDADAAISNSIAYTAVALAIPIAWALIDAVIKTYLGQVLPNSTLVGFFMAFVVVLVLTPTRTKALGWAEKRFQRALVRLRSLPAKLIAWQTSETPEELAQSALAAIVEGVRASGAALIGDGAPEGVVIASIGVDEDFLRARLAEDRPIDRRNDPFPIRVALNDGVDDQGVLLIGRRSDGAGYTRDERSAIATVKEPLTRALRAASRRNQQTIALSAALTEALATMERRLEELERRRAARRRKAES